MARVSVLHHDRSNLFSSSIGKGQTSIAYCVCLCYIMTDPIFSRPPLVKGKPALLRPREIKLEGKKYFCCMNIEGQPIEVCRWKKKKKNLHGIFYVFRSTCIFSRHPILSLRQKKLVKMFFFRFVCLFLCFSFCGTLCRKPSLPLFRSFCSWSPSLVS